MCNRFGLILLVATSVTARAAAQSGALWKDSALVLSRQARALRDSIFTGDSTVQEVARDGTLRLGATPTLRGTALSAFARLREARARWFGSALPSEEGFRILLNGAGEQVWSFGASPDQGQVLLVGMPDTGKAPRTTRAVREHQLATALVDLFAELMWRSAGAHLVLWLDPAPPLSMPESERRYVAMYAFVTGYGRAQRDCVAGRLADCAYTLGLAPPTSADPGGAFAAFLRMDLLLTALEAGGPGAWERLRPAVGAPMAPALAAAANMPLDSLLSRWRRELLALRPDTRPVDGPGILLTLGWTAAVGLAALGIARWL